MKKFLFFVLAVLTFAACEQALVEEQSAICPDVPETITAGFEGDDTRIQLNDAQKTVWTKGDLVSVFYLSDANQQWQYTGETGARTADLTCVDAGEATEQINRVVVLYPYNESYFINAETFNVQITLPAEQTYLEDSYGLNGNIMVSSGEFNQFKLKTVYGWLKLQLTGNGEKIKSITVRGNNGEQVAGEAYINTTDATMTLAADELATDDDSEAGGSLIFEDTILTEVTLDCGEGVELGAEATAFYIALPPQTFDGGITVEIATTDGAIMTKSTDNSIVIERNHIQPMTTFVYDGVRPQPNNEIWYIATKKVVPYKTNVFGATYLTNVWNSETGIGVITFNGDVTKIGEEAFYGCRNLTSVTIPNSVTTIGNSAFRGSNYITSVTIPDSVTTIGDSAFEACSDLTSVTIPDSVTTIGDKAFFWCFDLTSVTIGNNVTTIGKSAFYGNSLTSVTIPDSVTTIGDTAFGWGYITSATIGDSVTTIGENVFWACNSLKEFKGKFASDDGRCLIIDGVLNAFAIGCGVTQYTIPDSVTTIGDSAFYNCDSLTSVTIPDSVTTIGSAAFEDCDSLTSVTIGNSVTTIGVAPFHGCWSLKEFKGKFAADGGRCLIVNSILKAFAPAGLTEYTIPNSVRTIGDYAFYSSGSLTSVTIPNSVTKIGEGTFDACGRLKTIYCQRTIPPTGGERMFGIYYSGLSIYVPISSVAAYKNAKYWSDYADGIVGYNF